MTTLINNIAFNRGNSYIKELRLSSNIAKEQLCISSIFFVNEFHYLFVNIVLFLGLGKILI